MNDLIQKSIHCKLIHIYSKKKINSWKISKWILFGKKTKKHIFLWILKLPKSKDIYKKQKHAESKLDLGFFGRFFSVSCFLVRGQENVTVIYEELQWLVKSSLTSKRYPNLERPTSDEEIGWLVKEKKEKRWYFWVLILEDVWLYLLRILWMNHDFYRLWW